MCCLSASCTQTSSSCGPLPSPYVKPVNETKGPGKRLKRAAERNAVFCGKARQCLNFKEKLMDLILLTILIEQSADPGVEGSFSGSEINVSLCWGFYHKIRHLHLILRNDRFGEKKKSKHLSYRLFFKLYCFYFVF